MFRRALSSVAVALCLHAGVARGEGSAVDLASRAPSDVDVFVAVEGAATLRTGIISEAAAGCLDALAGYDQTAVAWKHLAEQLGMEPDQAFDGLLGRRFVVLGRTGTDDSGWALLSEVSGETAKLIGERLRPVPRELVQGAPVLAIEDGAFQIVVLDTPADWTRHGAPPPDAKVMALAPKSSRRLLEEAAASTLKRPAKALADDGDYAMLTTMRPGANAAVFVRVHGKADRKAGATPASAWFGMVLRRENNSLLLTAATRPPSHADEGGSAPSPDLPVLSESAFKRFSADAIFASLEDERTALGGQWTAVLEPLAKQLPWLSRCSEDRGLLTGRLASLVQESGDGLLDGAVGIETRSADDLARRADDAVACVLAGIDSSTAADPGGGAASGGADSMNFNGIEPEALRVLDVSRFVGPALSGTWENGARLAWRVGCPTRECESTGTPTCWLSVGLGPDTVMNLSSALSGGACEKLAKPGAAPATIVGEDPELPVRWLSMVVARPARFMEIFDKRGITLPRPADAFRWVREVHWNTISGCDGMVFGGGRIEFARPASGK